MKWLLSSLLLLAVLTPATAQAKDARCVIKQNGRVAYSGGCQFSLGKAGSFSIRRSGGMPFVSGITDIAVDIVMPGMAEVRGLTTQGINSRWGTAVRSRSDRACWTGTDFEICAY